MLFGLLFLVALHGISTIKILLIIGVNFIITRCFRGSVLSPVATWIFNVAVLFVNELYQGYHLGSFRAELAELDAFGGLLPRWEILFNITTLRLISYNMDYHWANQSLASPRKADASSGDQSERSRIDTSRQISDYSLVNYLAYLLYSPLYLAGPILTFNNFISQIYQPSQTITPKRTILYGIRLAFCMMTMETILHYVYVVAISKTKAWQGDTPFQLCMITYFNLQIIWLKVETNSSLHLFKLLIRSFLSLGGFSASGLCWMALSLLKICCVV